MIVGEFTPTSDVETYTVTFDKGDAPIIALCFAADIRSNNASCAMQFATGFLGFSNNIISAISINNWDGNVINEISPYYAGVTVMNSNSVTFSSRGGTYLYKAGVRYIYFIDTLFLGWSILRLHKYSEILCWRDIEIIVGHFSYYRRHFSCRRLYSLQL